MEILPKLPNDSIDLTLTSPPYDNLRDYKGFDFDFPFLVKELWRLTKKGGVLVWVIGDATINGSETGSSFRQALAFKDAGFNLHDTMVYEKSGFAFPSTNRYHQIFEFMFVFSKGNPKTFNPIKDKPNKSEYTFSKKRRRVDGTMDHENDTSRIAIEPYGMRTNIWRYKTGRGHSAQDDIAYNHPAIFPEELAKDHILSWTNPGDNVNPGDIVLDPMCGSGTTVKMAKILGRSFIGIDVSKEYCEIAQARLSKIR